MKNKRHTVLASKSQRVSKHQASKRGYKHAHNLSKGEKLHFDWVNRPIPCTCSFDDGLHESRCAISKWRRSNKYKTLQGR
jgi:hypothetical protein